MKHIIFFRSTKTVCPLCGGVTEQLYSDDIIIRCIDCNTYYRAIGKGHAEAELEFEEITIGEDV